MLKRSWVVFVVTAFLLAPVLAFADGPGATDRFLFAGGGTYALGGSSALIRATPPAPLLATSLLSTTPPTPPNPVGPHAPLPENWGVSDWLGFFALGLLAFGLL